MHEIYGVLNFGSDRDIVHVAKQSGLNWAFKNFSHIRIRYI